MDYAKMMFAVEVRKLAGVLYAEAFASQKKSNQAVSDHSHWIARNPPMSFVPAALNQLTEVASQISDSV